MATSQREPTRAQKETLLDLNTDRVVGRIKIDDKMYDLISINELSIIQQKKLTQAGQKLSFIEAIKTEAQEENYNDVLIDILTLIMPGCHNAILKKLSITKKLDIVNAYMEVSGMIKKKVTRKPQRKKKKR